MTAVASLVTFTSDFGEGSPYTAAMKARVLWECPAARLIDVSHSVPPFEVKVGGFVLWAGTRDFPAGSVHLAVVDPGVGGPRRAVAFVVDGRYYVGPDNGVFEYVLGLGGEADAIELEVPRDAAPTFHGRDVFAPAAGALAAGRRLSELGDAITGLARLPQTGPTVLWIDRFGNLITSLKELPVGLIVNGHEVRRFARTFAGAPTDEPFLYIGSLGHVEVGVREARADELLGVGPGVSIKVL